MANTTMIYITLLLSLFLPCSAGGDVKVDNQCSYEIWVNEIAPHAGLSDSWSLIPPHSVWTATQPPINNAPGVSEKVGLSRGATEVIQLEVAKWDNGRTLAYDMSSVDGNPFWRENRRLVCSEAWDPWPQHFCPGGDEGQVGNHCGKQNPGEAWRVMNAPVECGDIILILCGRA